MTPVALFDIVDAAVEAARPTLDGCRLEAFLSLGVRFDSD